MTISEVIIKPQAMEERLRRTEGEEEGQEKEKRMIGIICIYDS